MIVKINQDLCKACGICGHICPRHIPVTDENNNRKKTVISSERINLCMECGHCAAVCPNRAIQVKCLNKEKFVSVKELGIDDNQLFLLMKQRRSVRRYKDKPVPREIIDRIIDAAHSSPTGTGRMTTGVIVIDNWETLATFSELAYELYEGLEKNLRNPIARFFIKQREGKKILRTRPKITSHFRISSSCYLRPILIRKILEIVLLFLWFRGIGSSKSNTNLSANSLKLFLGEPLERCWILSCRECTGISVGIGKEKAMKS